MITLDGRKLDSRAFLQVVYLNTSVEIGKATLEKIHKGYQLIQEAAHSEKAYYGINTGFGALAEVRIKVADQKELQRNIILSHAVGVGEPLDYYAGRALLFLRLNTLIQGYSGASPMLVNHLLQLLNAQCAPYVPKKGSVGASGDLAPLAHLGLLLLGIGPAFHEKMLISAERALDQAGLSHLTLGVRDGLALMNGTQAMASLAATTLNQSATLSDLADIVASMSLQALLGHKAPFDERIHQLKPHLGQIKTAQTIRRMLKGYGESQDPSNSRTQDPYSLRCIPQVHGAAKDSINHVNEVVFKEINSVTDNPLIFINPDMGTFEIISGGNFHGQHLAFVLDYLALALAELASISERRIELLLNPLHSNGLPPFLINNSGLNSGYMMLHVTTAALVSENKILCHPASVDSIPTSASREDHVSMGMTAANKVCDIATNVKTVLAIEFMAACQAINLRQQDYISGQTKEIITSFRKAVPFRTKDGPFQDDLTRTLSWLDSKACQQLINDIAGDNGESSTI